MEKWHIQGWSPLSLVQAFTSQFFSFFFSSHYLFQSIQPTSRHTSLTTINYKKRDSNPNLNSHSRWYKILPLPPNYCSNVLSAIRMGYTVRYNDTKKGYSYKLIVESSTKSIMNQIKNSSIIWNRKINR